MTTPAARALPDSGLDTQRSRLGYVVKLAWPLAFVAVSAMAIGYLQHREPAPAEGVRVVHPTPTVLKDLRELSRLETLSLHVEKVIDVNDHQKRLYGLVDANDSLLFVATGDVVMGVDLGKLRDEDARFDAATRVAHVHLPAPEVLSTQIDEPHSYVHARSTDLLAKRNEALESVARREAAAAFAAAARDPKAIDRAKAQAEKELRALAKGWGASDVVFTWGAAPGAEAAGGEVSAGAKAL